MKLAFLLIPAILILVVVSCSKSNSGSKPTISIQSLNNPVDSGQTLTVNLKFTNGSNLSGANFLAIRIRKNVNPILGGNVASGSDTILTPIPTFSSNDQGQFVYTMPYGYLSTNDGQNDTLVFKFAAITNSNVSSDTISTVPITIINP